MHEALERKRPRTRTTPMIYDAEVGDRLAQLDNEARGAEAVARQHPDSDRAREAAEAARATYDEALDEAVESGAVVLFKLRGLSGKEYDDLVTAHPAPAEQRRNKKLPDNVRALPFDYKALPPRMVALSLVEPNLSETEVLSMWDSPEWSEGELGQLYETAMLATQSITRLSPGKG